MPSSERRDRSTGSDHAGRGDETTSRGREPHPGDLCSRVLGEYEGTERHERTRRRYGPDERGEEGVPGCTGTVGEGRDGADQPEQGGTDESQGEALAEGHDSEHGGVDGKQHTDSDQKGHLVVGAEQIDGDFLGKAGDEVDDSVPDGDDRRPQFTTESGDDLGDAEAESSTDQTRQRRYDKIGRLVVGRPCRTGDAHILCSDRNPVRIDGRGDDASMSIPGPVGPKTRVLKQNVKTFQSEALPVPNQGHALIERGHDGVNS